MIHRRDMLRCCAGAASAALAAETAWSPAAEKAPRTGMGIVIYSLSLRRQAERQRDPKADLFEPLTLLDYCRQLGAGGIQFPLGVRDEPFTKTLRQRAEQYGMFLETTTGAPRDAAAVERFEAEVRTAAQAGVRAMRTVLIPGRRYESFDSAEKFREAVAQAHRSLELAAPVVARHRVPLAVENHKDQRAAQHVEMLKRIGSPWIGACVDTGNNLALLEDPIEAIEALAPYAFAVHLKDHAVREYEDGFLLADVPLGQGCLDLKRMVSILRKAKPDIRFSLELITRDPLKVPCLTDKYWATFPGQDRSGSEQTLKMVQKHRAARLPEVSSLSPEDRVAREDANVKASLTYARQQLGL